MTDSVAARNDPPGERLKLTRTGAELIGGSGASTLFERCSARSAVRRVSSVNDNGTFHASCCAGVCVIGISSGGTNAVAPSLSSSTSFFFGSIGSTGTNGNLGVGVLVSTLGAAIVVWPREVNALSRRSNRTTGYNRLGLDIRPSVAVVPAGAFVRDENNEDAGNSCALILSSFTES
jgi:hypothetical protein